MTASFVGVLSFAVFLCITISGTNAGKFSKNSPLYMRVKDLQVSERCNDTKNIFYETELYGDRKEDCKKASGFVADNQDGYWGCTKSELATIRDILCLGTDPFKEWHDLNVTDECKDYKKTFYERLIGNQVKDCKKASGFVADNQDGYRGCTKSELTMLRNILCLGTDPFKEWHDLNVSDDCISYKKLLFERFTGYQGKDCKIASDLFTEDSRYGKLECTMNELYKMKDIVCKKDDPFKIWHAVEVNSKCYNTKNNLYALLSGNRKEYLEGALAFFTHYENGYNGCTKKEMQMLKAAVAGATFLWLSWSLMVVCLFIQMAGPYLGAV